MYRASAADWRCWRAMQHQHTKGFPNYNTIAQLLGPARNVRERAVHIRVQGCSGNAHSQAQTRDYGRRFLATPASGRWAAGSGRMQRCQAGPQTLSSCDANCARC
jgi:hypothetical protein